MIVSVFAPSARRAPLPFVTAKLYWSCVVSRQISGASGTPHTRMVSAMKAAAVFGNHPRNCPQVVHISA
jgi:hypothetical protein